MSRINHFSTLAEKRKNRIRKKILGTKIRPRLTVFRSNCHISLQVVDDSSGKTLIGATDMGKKAKYKGTKTAKTVQLSQELAKELQVKKIKKLVFDRGSYKYHGRVKAVAETLREAGVII